MSNEIKTIVAATSFASVTAENLEVTRKTWAEEIGLALNHLALTGHIVTLGDNEYVHLGTEMMPTVVDADYAPIALSAADSNAPEFEELATSELTVKNPEASFDERLENILKVAIAIKVPFTFFMIKVGGLVMEMEPTDTFYTAGLLDGPKVDAYVEDFIAGSDIENATEWMNFSKVLAALGM